MRERNGYAPVELQQRGQQRQGVKITQKVKPQERELLSILSGYFLLLLLGSVPFILYLLFFSQPNDKIYTYLELQDPKNTTPPSERIVYGERHRKRDILQAKIYVFWNSIGILGYICLFFLLNLDLFEYGTKTVTVFRVISFIVISVDITWNIYRIYYNINIRIPEINSFYYSALSPSPYPSPYPSYSSTTVL
jgi:hypothetical protein